eukprot:3753433-Prymnesium_polylepis.1
MRCVCSSSRPLAALTRRWSGSCSSRAHGERSGHGNKLSKRQYDETTWSARSWLSFQSQKLS